MVQIIFYSIIILLLIYISFFKKTKNIVKPINEIDVDLTDLNKFIRRETLFQLITWFNSSVNVKNMSSIDHTSVLINDLRDTTILQKKMSAITATIVGNMSPILESTFYNVYKKDSNELPNLVNYVSRQVMFYIRKVNVDITSLFSNNIDKPVDELLKMYTLGLENEIYKTNDIVIISENPETSGEKEVN